MSSQGGQGSLLLGKHDSPLRDAPKIACQLFRASEAFLRIAGERMLQILAQQRSEMLSAQSVVSGRVTSPTSN